MSKKECEAQNRSRKIKKTGLCLLVTLGVIISGISGFAIYQASMGTVANQPKDEVKQKTHVKSNENQPNDELPSDELPNDELFPSEPLPKEYEADNLYVQVNNGLINAMNDYQDGKITEKEYLAIVEELNEVVDSEGGIEKMREDEQKFRKLTQNKR